MARAAATQRLTGAVGLSQKCGDPHIFRVYYQNSIQYYQNLSYILNYLYFPLQQVLFSLNDFGYPPDPFVL